MRQLARDAKPRGSCPTCHQGFRPATDAQWEQRSKMHVLFSLRHKKYLALQQQTAGAQQDVRQ